MHLEYADWPQAAREKSLNWPWAICDITDGFKALDNLIETVDGPDLLFAKLGAKSWRDSGSVRPLPRDFLLKDRLLRMLQSLTPQQEAIVRGVKSAGEPLYLYLFPWLDLSRWSEVRVLVGGGGAKVTSWRGKLSSLDRDAVLEFAVLLAGYIQHGGVHAPSCYVDVAFAEDGDCKLVEFNPAGLSVSMASGFS